MCVCVYKSVKIYLCCNQQHKESAWGPTVCEGEMKHLVSGRLRKRSGEGGKKSVCVCVLPLCSLLVLLVHNLVHVCQRDKDTYGVKPHIYAEDFQR